MNKILILILFIALLGTGYYFYTTQNKIKDAPLSVPLPTPQSPKTITLPIDPNKPPVSSVSVTYNFEGRITEIKQTNGSTLITLDTSTPEIPQFIVSKNTRVYKLQDDSTLKVTDLKVGDSVGIGATYRLKDKNLEIFSVYLK